MELLTAVMAAVAGQVEESPRLSPEQLGQLAGRMAETDDPAEASQLEQHIVRGFYRGEPHA